VPTVPHDATATASLDSVRQAYEASYHRSTRADWAFHDTQEPLMRYLRDRRIRIALTHALAITRRSPQDLTALVVCGGVGGEGTYLKNLGCRSVTVTDFSQHALEICLNETLGSRHAWRMPNTTTCQMSPSTSCSFRMGCMNCAGRRSD